MTCEVCKFIAIVFSVVDSATIFQPIFTKHVCLRTLRIRINLGCNR
jgi:hypothetical protein